MKPRSVLINLRVALLATFARNTCMICQANHVRVQVWQRLNFA